MSGRDVSSLGDLEKLYLINRFRYWENAVFQRVRSRKGKKDRSKHFSVQIQFAGRRAEFGLGTANKAVAARKAREIHEHIKVNGWTVTLAKFKWVALDLLSPAPSVSQAYSPTSSLRSATAIGRRSG